MAKQIKRVHAQFTGDATEWTKLNVIYTVEDSADTSLTKDGQVVVTYETTDTIAELHAAVKAAVETEEGIS